MQIRVRGLALSFLFLLVVLLALPAVSVADDSQVLTTHISMFCPHDINVCSVSPYVGVPGNAAGGHVNFNSIEQPWSFSFQTANPTHWQCDTHCEDYYATFAVGGSFLMNGPDGLTFSGEVTSGKAWQNVDLTWGADLSFSGQWSNGLSAYGDLSDLVTDWNGPYASLDVYTVPEPASLALMGGGMLAVWGMRKRIS